MAHRVEAAGAAPAVHRHNPNTRNLMFASNLEIFPDSVDPRQPLDGSHCVMTRHNRAYRISMILAEITAVHLVSDQHFRLKRFCSTQTTGIRDRTGRYRPSLGI